MITKQQFIEDAKARGVTDPAIIESKAQEYIQKFGDFKQEAKKVTPKTPEQLKTLINEEKRKAYQEMGFGEKMLVGAGKTGYSTFVAPVQKYLLGQGKKAEETAKEYAIASQGDLASRIGEVASDAALLLAPVGAAAGAVKSGGRLLNLGLKGLAGGSVSAGAHELQRQSMGEGSGPAEALTEVAVSTALPIVSGSLAQYLKKTAPAVLQSALKPIDKYKRSINKPQFEVPLKEGLATNFGGVEALARNVKNRINQVGNVFENVIAKSDIQIDHDDVLMETQKLLKKNINKGGFGVKDFEDAMSAAPEAVKNAAFEVGEPTNGSLLVDGLKALKLQRSAGPKGRWNAFSANVKTPNEAKFWESYNRAISKKIDEAIENKGSSDVLSAYRSAKKDLARLVPIQKTAEHAVGRMANNFKPGLLDINAGGVGANLGGGIGAGMAMGARRGLSTVGGANMMYGAGEMLEAGSPAMSQLLRSGAFNE